MKKLFTKLMAVVAILVLSAGNVGAQTATYSGTFPITMQGFAQVCTAPVTAGWAGTTSAASSTARDGKCFTTATDGNFNTGRNITYRLPYCGTVTIQANGTVGRGFIITVKKVSDATQLSRTVWAYGNATCSTTDIVVNSSEPVNVTILSASAAEAPITSTGSSYVSYVNISGLPVPSITAFSAMGVSAAINQTAKTITAELPYGTNLSAITPTVTLGGTATSYEPGGVQNFSAGAVNYIAKDANPANDVTYAVTLTAAATASSDKTLSAVTIGGFTPQYDAGTKTYSIILPKASSLTQAVVFTKPLTAGANFTSGNTHDFTTPLDITVIAQDNSTEIYHLQAVVGTKNIAYVTASGNSDPYLRGSLVAKGYYVEDVIAASQTASYFANHDLAILFDVVNSANTLALNMKDLIGTKRFLNLKAFMYGKVGWPTGAAVNVAVSKVATVATNYVSHPIFTGLTFTNSDITLVDAGVTGNGVQGVTTPGTGASIAKMFDNTAASCIIEDNTVESAMYLMVGLANGATAGLAYISADGKKLLDNSVAYLLGDTKYVPTTTALSKSTSSTLSFDGQIIRNPNQEFINVYDAVGRKVISSNKEINMHNYAKGIYIVKLQNGSMKISNSK
jgi:hypothetical protein